jgi:guanylate kinase
MLGLSELTEDYSFNVDRTYTTRPRRPNEGDKENIFLSHSEFDERKKDMLFTFQTFPTYEYGLAVPKQLDDSEIRMRILMPVHAKIFRDAISEPVLLCAVEPYIDNPEEVFINRDPAVDPEDLLSRMQRFYTDKEDACRAADFCFKNKEGIYEAVKDLGKILMNAVRYSDTMIDMP